MTTRNVVLTDHLSAFVDGLVASGRYQNASEALRAGLRLLEQQEAEWAEVRRGVLEGLDQVRRGEFAEGTGEEAIRRAFAKAVERSKA
jgi:antitoxin ParD1/3/4